MLLERIKHAQSIALLGYIDIRRRLGQMLRDQSGQGTTEYAILVGVMVVIAIVAILAFRSKLEELWRSITEAVNSL